MSPQEIKNEIARLRTSRANQINVEFEGVAPDHEMPQGRKIVELVEQLRGSGYIIINDVLYSRDEIQTIREAFNGRVKQYMTDNPGQKVPSESLVEWQDEAGMTVGQIKNAVQVLGM